MSAPIAGPPPTAPVDPIVAEGLDPENAARTAPPVEKAVENATPAKRIPADWRDRLTDADLPVLLAVLREHHARRRPLHTEARDLQHRIEGTTR